LKANVQLKPDQGEIFSDSDMQMQKAAAEVKKNEKGRGKFRVTLDKGMRGTINGGGQEIQFNNFNLKTLFISCTWISNATIALMTFCLKSTGSTFFPSFSSTKTGTCVATAWCWHRIRPGRQMDVGRRIL